MSDPPPDKSRSSHTPRESATGNPHPAWWTRRANPKPGTPAISPAVSRRCVLEFSTALTYTKRKRASRSFRGYQGRLSFAAILFPSSSGKLACGGTAGSRSSCHFPANQKPNLRVASFHKRRAALLACRRQVSNVRLSARGKDFALEDRLDELS